MKKVLSLSLLTLLLSGVGLSFVKGDNEEYVPIAIKEETYVGADFSSGIYSYELDEKFKETPNTFEVWVRLGNLPKGEAGGVIFGNYEYYNYTSINLEVNENRNVCLDWNHGEVEVVFNAYDLKVDTWEHISVVRDVNNKTFNLYVNGNIVQKINVNTGSDVLSDYKFIVGGDWSNWRVAKNLFKGEIGQVTVYSKTLNSREIYKDYLYDYEIDSEHRQNLLFNAEFSLDCLEAIDTSSNRNNATIRSNDYFYDGEIYEAKDYSIAVIPDPQVMTHWLHGNLPSISEYIIEKDESHNVAMALCVGDNADGVASSHPQLDMDYQLGAIKKEYDKLYDAGIPWATTPGNHDYDNNSPASRGLVDYNKYFSHDELMDYDYFGDVYKDGETQNAYYLIEECGVKYLIISIEFGANDNVLDWANEVVEQYPDRRVIVFTHAYIGGDGEVINGSSAHRPSSYGFAKGACNDPYQIFDKFIKKHSNIFMVFSGHVCSDDIFMKEAKGENGNTIYQFLMDAQGIMMTGCESLVSMLTFDELNQKVYVNYESTTTRELYNIQNQFEFSFEGSTDILSSIYYDEDGNLKELYK